MLNIDKFIKINDYISSKYAKIDYLHDNRALVVSKENNSKSDKNLYGYIDADGNEVIPCEYTRAYRFSEGIAYVEKDDEKYFIDKDNNIVLNISALFPTFYAVDEKHFSDGLFCFFDTKKEKYGYIDKNGEIAISFKYDIAYRFSEGLALVRYNGKYCYINKKGARKIEEPKSYRFDYCFPYFGGGVAVIYNEINLHYPLYIDKVGNISNSAEKLKIKRKPIIREDVRNKPFVYCTDINFGGEKFTFKASTKEELTKQKKELMLLIQSRLELEIQKMNEEETMDNTHKSSK